MTSQLKSAAEVTTPSSTNDVASNGATDLKDGNMAVPGKVGTSSTRADQRVQQAIKGVSDQVAASVEKIGDVVTKVAGTASEAGNVSDAGTASEAGDAGSDS